MQGHPIALGRADRLARAAQAKEPVASDVPPIGPRARRRLRSGARRGRRLRSRCRAALARWRLGRARRELVVHRIESVAELRQQHARSIAGIVAQPFDTRGAERPWEGRLRPPHLLVVEPQQRLALGSICGSESSSRRITMRERCGHVEGRLDAPIPLAVEREVDEHAAAQRVDILRCQVGIRA